MSGPVERVLARLKGVRKVPGGFKALCPAHDDHDPSLSVSEGEDGRALLYCHALCPLDAVLDAIGMTEPDLFESNGDSTLRRETARHPYHDRDGVHLFDIVRFNTDPKCLPFLPGSDRSGIGETARPLYRLPALLAAVKAGETVYVAEGEKDADALVKAGVVATTNPFGAGPEKWQPQHTEALKGAHVVIVRDRDEPGRKRGEHLLRVLGGVASSVRLVEPVVGKDAHDHLHAGRSVDELVAVAGITAPAQPGGLDWQPLSQVKMVPVRFLDPPLWQADTFHLIVGRKGMGKGTLIADVASRVTRGELGEKRNVIWVASEDSAGIDILPRVVAAGGDPARISVVKTGWVQLPRDIDQIRRKMVEVGDVGLLIIDPVGNHIAGKESNNETDIRDAIAPLNRLADEQQCLVVGVRHLTEKDPQHGVVAAILGSSAWVQVPRAVIAIVRDDEDQGVRHVQVVAGNRHASDTLGRMFRIEGVLLDGHEHPVTRAAWLGDSTKDIETMLRSGSAKNPSRSEAARHLIGTILEREGDQESDALDARVAQEIGIAAKTAKNVRTQLREAGLIKSRPEKDEDGTVTRWMVGRTQAPWPGLKTPVQPGPDPGPDTPPGPDQAPGPDLPNGQRDEPHKTATSPSRTLETQKTGPGGLHAHARAPGPDSPGTRVHAREEQQDAEGHDTAEARPIGPRETEDLASRDVARPTLTCACGERFRFGDLGTSRVACRGCATEERRVALAAARARAGLADGDYTVDIVAGLA